MPSDQYRICGVYEGTTLLYLGRADRPCTQWFYGLKQREPFSWYAKRYPEKHFHIKTLASFKQNDMRDTAFFDMYRQLKPLIPNGSLKGRERVTVSSPVNELVESESH